MRFHHLVITIQTFNYSERLDKTNQFNYIILMRSHYKMITQNTQTNTDQLNTTSRLIKQNLIKLRQSARYKRTPIGRESGLEMVYWLCKRRRLHSYSSPGTNSKHHPSGNSIGQMQDASEEFTSAGTTTSNIVYTNNKTYPIDIKPIKKI